MSLEEYRELVGLEAKPNKYHAHKTTIQGMTFDSKKEAGRYLVLNQMSKDGLITDLVCQPSFKFLIDGGVLRYTPSNRAVKYIADFQYTLNGERIVEDVKSPVTASLPAYKLKKALMLAVNGIQIKET
jgi:hypothetical protein